METNRQKKMIYRYLLGELSEAEQTALVREVFADDEKFELVWAIENELVDHYVRGHLAPAERRSFENHYLASPVHRERVAFAQTLVQAADADREEVDSERKPSVAWRLLALLRGSPARWLTAAAMLVLVAGSFWVIREGWRLREQLNQLKADRAVEQQRTQELEKAIGDERERNDQLTAELQRWRQESSHPPEQPPGQMPPHQVAHPSVVSLLLSPMLMRSQSEPQQLHLSKETVEVRLQMKVQEAAKTFHISLQTVEGAPVWSRRATKARAQENKGSLISVAVPAHILSTGDYILILAASAGSNEPQEINRYFFRVLRP
jgi:hypothetical protein